MAEAAASLRASSGSSHGGIKGCGHWSDSCSTCVTKKSFPLRKPCMYVFVGPGMPAEGEYKCTSKVSNQIKKRFSRIAADTKQAFITVDGASAGACPSHSIGDTDAAAKQSRTSGDVADSLRAAMASAPDHFDGSGRTSPAGVCQDVARLAESSRGSFTMPTDLPEHTPDWFKFPAKDFLAGTGSGFVPEHYHPDHFGVAASMASPENVEFVSDWLDASADEGFTKDSLASMCFVLSCLSRPARAVSNKAVDPADGRELGTVRCSMCSIAGIDFGKTTGRATAAVDGMLQVGCRYIGTLMGDELFEENSASFAKYLTGLVQLTSGVANYNDAVAQMRGAVDEIKDNS